MWLVQVMDRRLSWTPFGDVLLIAVLGGVVTQVLVADRRGRCQ